MLYFGLLIINIKPMIKNDSNSIDASTIMTKMKDEAFFTVADLFDSRDSKDISWIIWS